MPRLFMTTAAAALIATAGLAQAQQTVNVFNWSDYIAPDTLEKFTAATGIDVNYDVYDSNDTLEARMMAGSSGFDVVVPTGNYLQRQIAAGIYQPLDKSLLPNLVNMDPQLMALAAAFDPGNEHAVIYHWGTTGIGYNVQAVADRLGADYPVNSWDLVFDPEIAGKLADCGISWLDDATEVLPAALRYLGLDPNSTNPDDLNAAADLLNSVRDTVRYFNSSQYISDLANGEICVAIGWSGDVLQAAARAEEVGNGININYVIPDEGANLWFDMMAIPADAPHPAEAYAFINFMMDPQIAAANTNYVAYANANDASTPYIDPAILNDPRIYPNAQARENLWTMRPYDARTDRLVTRLWTRIRTGQ